MADGYRQADDDEVERTTTRTAVVQRLYDCLLQSDFYASFVRDVQGRLLWGRTCSEESKMAAPTAAAADFKADLRKMLVDEGLEGRLRGTIYVLWTSTNPEVVRRHGRHHPKEPLDYLRSAQVGWERRISKPLNRICIQHRIPLSRKRSADEQKDLEDRWNELGVDESACGLADELCPVYAPKDLLDALCRLSSPNATTTTSTTATGTGCDGNGQESDRWNLMSLPIKSKTIDALRVQFPELSLFEASPTNRLGIDDGRRSMTPLSSMFDRSTRTMSIREQRTLLANAVVSTNYGPLAREFAKRGCPQSERARIWCQILGVQLTATERRHYALLKRRVVETELMIDRLMIRDVKLTASNYDEYFVFKDYLYQVMLLFSRDDQVLEHFDVSSATPLKAVTRTRATDSVDTNSASAAAAVVVEEVVYPPNGVIPFHGFTMLVSPLCYMYDDPVTLYFMFRALYTVHFFRLHTINSHPQGILRLSLLFESLVRLREPDLCEHFRTRRIRPLRVAFKWLSRCFSGYLPIEELLLVWDIALAYDTFEIVAVLAAAVVTFRASILRQTTNQQEMEAVLNDLSSIQVVPLLVHYLST